MDLLDESLYEHIALEAAINHILPCAEISIVKPKTSQNAAYGTETGSSTVGEGLNFTCVKKAPDSFTVKASWTIPLERQDGTPLLLTEIDHYLMEYNGKTIELPNDQTEYTINGLSKGELTIKLSTVDTDGLISIPAEVTTTIE